ncbi:hypothetical protein Lalb_Chr01g0002011 [Lupinus albus]|uniref:Uncharacterized protein n=1 Tax=Lupinus albus TaxID=3870 RepID=A0A6A4R4N0_LUPAL|nr:hypothetical protein Lalb_Chr01g0002011 [Lupinus albus]
MIYGCGISIAAGSCLREKMSDLETCLFSYRITLARGTEWISGVGVFWNVIC